MGGGRVIGQWMARAGPTGLRSLILQLLLSHEYPGTHRVFLMKKIKIFNIEVNDFVKLGKVKQKQMRDGMKTRKACGGELCWYDVSRVSGFDTQAN